MDDLDGQYTLSDDSLTEKWCDIAKQIEYGYQMLCEEFDSDTDRLQAYLERVAQVDPAPLCGVQQWAEEGLDAAGSTFAELVNDFPIEPELHKEDDRVFRRKMVLFCSEWLKAKTALQTGLTDKAWWHWSCACSHEGQAQGYQNGAKSTTDKIRSGRMGGLAKEEKKREAVKSACITYLENDRPPGGWMSPDAAIKDVVPKVKKKLLGKQIEGLDVDALLHVWLKGNSEVQKAGGFKMRCTKE